MRCGKRIALSDLSETYCMRVPGHEGPCSTRPDQAAGKMTDLILLTSFRERWQREREAKISKDGNLHNGT